MKEVMDMKMMIRKSERTIELTAKSFVGKYCTYEELLMVGRKIVLKTLETNCIVDETFEAFKNFIRTELEVGFRSFLKSIKGLSKTKNKALAVRDDVAVKEVIYKLVRTMKLKSAEVPKKINYATFVNFGLQKYLWVFFNNSPYRALRMAYPELRPEDMNRRPNGYWDDPKNLTKAIKEFKTLLKSSGYRMEDFPLIVNEDFIVDHGFRTPLNKFFNGSPFTFLDAAFPGKYRPWNMSVTPMKCFADEAQVIKATKWLVETILGFDMDNLDEYEIWRLNIGQRIEKEDFEKNGLRGLLSRFNNSPGKILLFVYSGKFKEWSFSNKDKWSRGAESLELAARATRWVIEEYARIEPSSKIGYKFFIDNGLHGMITSKKLGFNSSPKAALENAYPERRNILKPL